MTIRWRVAAGELGTVGAVVERAGGDAAAIADGRVFIGRRRVDRAADAVNEGDEILIAPPDEAPAPPVTIVALDADVVVADKPASIPTIPDQRGAARSLLALVAAAIDAPTESLHPTSRLDRDVSGLVLFTRTKRAAGRIRQARELGNYVRRYVAVATRPPEPEAGVWIAPIGRANDPKLRAVGGHDAVDARTRYRVVSRAGGAALLAVAPETGRTHQIRVHASHAGAPLFGDRSYGGPRVATLPDGRRLGFERIALHCAKVSVLGATYRAAVPAALAELWRALGGDASAWDTAASCPLDAP